MRSVKSVYHDPLDLIWIATAAQLGISVERDSSVFAAWDGCGVLTIGLPESLDADDTLAQLIFHEICHGLVEGPDAFHKPDWGLDLGGRGKRVHEHACLRLQSALAARYGLRTFLAATTDFQTLYDQLPDDPLDDQSHDPAVALARGAWERATSGPWSQPLDRALRATARIAQIVRPFATGDSLWLQANRLDAVRSD